MASTISQSHGFTFGDASSQTNIKTACANTASSMAISDEDLNANMPNCTHSKLTTTNLSLYDIKIRRRRACQMKALIVLLALLAAGCIGCILGYFFIRYNNENLRHLKYTQNMVAERNSKLFFFTCFCCLILVLLYYSRRSINQTNSQVRSSH
jgi:hypothetical protein